MVLNDKGQTVVFINDKPKTLKAKADGWSNVLSGFGGSLDKRTYTEFGSVDVLTKDHMSMVYVGDGLGTQIIDAIPDDMTRQWLTLVDEDGDESDDGKRIKEDMERLNTQEQFNFALKMARLLGGSLVYIGAMDGRKHEEPLGKIKSVEYLKVYDLAEIQTSECKFDENMYSPTYGQIIQYAVRPSTISGIISEEGQPTEVILHASRCIPFHGLRVPPSFKQGLSSAETRFWGMSTLQPVWEKLRDFNGVMANVSNILYELVIGKYKLADLDEILSQGNENMIKTRIQAIDLSKSLIHAVLLGTDEDYIRDSISISGISDVLDRFMMLLSSTTRIPVTRLFGRSPSGLNATGENDIRNYYDMIGAEQSNKLDRKASKLIEILGKSLGIKTLPKIKWNPLQQMSQKEKSDDDRVQAESYRTVSDGDQRYIAEGVLLPEDVYELRFKKKLGARDFTDMPDPRSMMNANTSGFGLPTETGNQAEAVEENPGR